MDQPKPELYDQLSDPQILVMSDGTLVATVQHTGHYGFRIGSYLYRSIDRGSRWTKVLTLEAADRVRLFEVGGSLYLVSRDAFCPAA